MTLFLAAAITDFFDGYLARSRNQVSTLGKLLDPLADKLLISAALISLVENQLVPAWAAVVIIGREFAVTGLRSVAATEGFVISASRAGKFKMWAQVISIAFLIAASAKGRPPVGNFGQPFPAIMFWTVTELRTALHHFFGAGAMSGADWQIILYTIGRAGLWVVVVSALFSMYGYFKGFYRGATLRQANQQILQDNGTATTSHPV